MKATLDALPAAAADRAVNAEGSKVQVLVRWGGFLVACATMSFGPDDDTIKAMIDSGFLPPRKEALRSVANAVKLRTRCDEERANTPDGLLLDVMISFNVISGEILSIAELPGFGPSIALPFTVARHTLAIADVLTALTKTGRPIAARPVDYDLRERWVDAIIDLCLSEDLMPGPWHPSANAYVGIGCVQLDFAVQALRANPWISLDPGDSILAEWPMLSPDDRRELDPEFAARTLAWQGAAAICIAACLLPEFRLGAQPSRN